MPKKKFEIEPSVVPSFADADPLGTAYGGDGTGGGAYRIPTGGDWLTYDKFVCGMLAIEIFGEPSETRAKNEILADIQFMREEMREAYPGATDTECDAIRRETLLIKAGFIDGSAPGLGRAEAAHVRLVSMLTTIQSRTRFDKRREFS